MFFSSKSYGIAVGVMAVAVSVNGYAAVGKTQTTSFTAQTNVVDQCNAVTATAMTFPTYTPDDATASAAQSTITVACTKNSLVSISLHKGTTDASTSARKMKNANGSTLDYGLYSDSSRTTNWDDTGGKVSFNGLGLGTPVSKTVYGKIPVSQLDTEPGSYSDTITVTVGY